MKSYSLILFFLFILASSLLKGQETETWQELPFNSRMVDKLTKFNFTKEEIELAVQTSDNLLYSNLSYSYKGNSTTVRVEITPQNSMFDTTLFVFLHHCFADNLANIHFNSNEFTIINEEQMVIAWYYVNVDQKAVLTFEVEGLLDPSCIKQLILAPISKKIIKEDGSSISIIIGVSLIVILAILTIFLLSLFFNKKQKMNKT